MQNTLINPDEILANLKKLPKTAMICLVFGGIMLALALGGLVVAINGEDLGWIFVIVGGIFALMFFVIILAKKIKSSRKLKSVDLKDVRSELLIGCNSYNKAKTYFTDSYMLSNYYYSFVVKYSDIAWIYKFEKRAQNGMKVGNDLVIRLKNGKKEYTTYDDNFCEEIEKRNKDVFEGYSIENNKRYKELVKEYKKNSANLQNNISTNQNSSTNMVNPNELQAGQPSNDVHEVPSIPEPAPVIAKNMSEIDPIYSMPGMVNNVENSTPTVEEKSNINFFSPSEINMNPEIIEPQAAQINNTVLNPNEQLNLSQQEKAASDNNPLNNIFNPNEQNNAVQEIPQNEVNNVVGNNVQMVEQQNVMPQAPQNIPVTPQNIPVAPQTVPATPQIMETAPEAVNNNVEPAANPQEMPGAIRNPFLDL